MVFDVNLWVEQIVMYSLKTLKPEKPYKYYFCQFLLVIVSSLLSCNIPLLQMTGYIAGSVNYVLYEQLEVKHLWLIIHHYVNACQLTTPSYKRYNYHIT